MSTPRLVELSPLHDFAGKLLQPQLIARLRAYVRMRAEARKSGSVAGLHLPVVNEVASSAPISINLDLTTACNYRCDHCVDIDILNQRDRFELDRLKAALSRLAAAGMRSVILIGGGEPTIYPGFAEVVRQLKDDGVQVGIVSNGGRLEAVAEVIDRLDAKDWIRLSLDAGSDELFQAMHRPRKPITLDEICAHVPRLKSANRGVRIGFSFIVVWSGSQLHEVALRENVHEIVLAAVRAKRYEFDYISYKPFLTRASANNAEVIGLTKARGGPSIVERIRGEVERAKELAEDGFAVVESTNLRVLETGAHEQFSRQPRECHMQFFRQVLSPLGVYNCPVYRSVPHARIGDPHLHSTAEGFLEAQRRTRALIERFDASEECKEVTCLYNHANWMIEELIEHPEKLETLSAAPERGDYFF